MSDPETLKGTLFWREIRAGLFVHNERWDKTIERLPGLLSASAVLKKLQTINQLCLSGMKGIGSIGFKDIEVTPNLVTLKDALYNNDQWFPVENLFLQWVYQFYLVEAISANFHNTPISKWPLSFLNIVDDNLHAMTYIAALILLYEEGHFKAIVATDNFKYTEHSVILKVEELTKTLYTKCAEYGESFRRHGLQGTLPRLWDKIARYAQLSALGRDAMYEPKRDSAKDLLGYCLIAWSLVHELEDTGEMHE